MDEFKNPNNTMDAIWCVDSETGKRYLLDRKTGQVIATQEEIDNADKRH